MRKMLFAALAALAIIATAAPVERAQAMTLAAPSQLGLTDDAGLVQKTAWHCGYWGCRHYWGPRFFIPHIWIGPWPHRHWGSWGWHRYHNWHHW
jgi:hypothetical protein